VRRETGGLEFEPMAVDQFDVIVRVEPVVPPLADRILGRELRVRRHDAGRLFRPVRNRRFRVRRLAAEPLVGLGPNR